MLKGHVFSKQLFENPIFALFINTFLNGINGVSNNYKNGMQVTYSGSTLTVDSGAVCIQGRFLEEDTSTPIATGTNNAYCKLVIEIDLDKQNTESQFNQASYKVITSASGYPNLTQTNIVKNVSGIYQYELARFRTTASGITDFQDMRTFLDFNSIYEQITEEYQSVLQQLQEELESVEDGSAYVLKNNFATLTGTMTFEDSPCYLDYPAGFNKDNCMIIGILSRNSTERPNVWFTPVPNYTPSSTGQTYGNNIYAVLDENKVNIYTNMSLETEDWSIDFKITLMKI